MSKHVVHDSSDEAQIKRALDWQKDRDRDLDAILASPRGRRFLHEVIFDLCHVEARSHVPGDPESSAFNEGARMVGQILLERIRERDFDAFVLMLSEARADD